MHAYFDAQDGNPKVLIKVKGTHRKAKEVAALLDTGHTGSLSLPILDLIEIGAKLESFGPVGLADGSTANMFYFSVTVEIDGTPKKVQASMINNPRVTQPIAGLQLMAPYIAYIDFKNKKILFTTEGELKKKLTSSK